MIFKNGHSIANQKKNTSTLMNDSSINLVIDEYMADDTEKSDKKALMAIPINNFTKIKEIETIAKGKCQSDRIKKCIHTNF